MTIDLTFFMQTSVTSSDLIATARDSLRQSGNEPDRIAVLEARLSALRKEIINEALGFEPTTAVQFRLDTAADVPEQMRLILELALGLLDRHEGDAALIYNGDIVYFVRRGTHLMLNAADDLWGPDRTALIHGPHTREVFALL